MGVQVSSVMTPNPVCVPMDLSVTATAAIMRDNDIGAVIIMNDDRVAGIVTDRDVVVRGVAEGFNPLEAPIGAVASPAAICLPPEASTTEAVHQMREASVRRLPVCDGAGHPVGIVSLGDLVEELDPESALADISASTPNI